MINKPPPFKDLNIGIPIVIPIKGRGVINHESGVLRQTVLTDSQLLKDITTDLGSSTKMLEAVVLQLMLQGGPEHLITALATTLLASTGGTASRAPRSTSTKGVSKEWAKVVSI